MPNFDESIEIVLKHEGGFIDTAYDAGGATKYGISSARYPELDIKNLTLSDAKAIYHRDFWKQFRIDQIKNQAVANLILDIVVLHGKGVQLIQKALNLSGQKVAIDNRIGPETIGALNKVNPATFINNAVAVRKQYMQSLVDNNPTQAKFLKGWFKRADFFLTTKQAKAGGSVVIVAIALFIGYKIYQSNKKKK